MAAPLNKVGKVVDEAGQVRAGAQLVVRPGTNVALIRYQGSEVRTRDDVAAVASAPAGRETTFTVTFADGAEWTVTPRSRSGCRSCGGSH